MAYEAQLENPPILHQAVKIGTAVTVSGSLLILSGLALSGTVIGLTIATPVLIIFSPVLVPAAITVFLLMSGFLTSGVFGVVAITVLSWMHKVMTGRFPLGASELDDARPKLATRARAMKDRAEQQQPQQQATGARAS